MNQAPRKSWLRPTVTAKFLLLLFGFLALQSLQLGVGVYSMQRIEQQSMLANAIHEQRLHTIQLGELARKALGQSVETSSARHALAFSMISYGQGLLRVETTLARRHGDDANLLGLAGEAGLAWDELLYPMLQQARAAPSRTNVDDTLNRYQALSAVQVERLNRMLRVLEQSDRHVARQLAWAQTIIVGLSLFLVVIGAFLMRHLVTRPLRSFFDITRAMADGAYDRRVEVYSNDEIGDLARAFNRMAAAVEDKTDRLRAFNEVALAVTSSLSLQEILDRIMGYGMPLTGARGVCIAFHDEATKSFSNWITRGLSNTYVASISFPSGGMGDEVMRGDDYALSSDKPGSAFPLTAADRGEGIHSIVCLPLAIEQQRLGVIYFFRGEGQDFSFEDIELIRTFAYLAARAIQNARLHERTVDLAETDALTGLYNRRKLEQRLREEIQRAQRSTRPLALLLLDIDYFKRINDRHGHATGDSVLKAVAEIFRREVRDVDLVARTGGEEFMFLLPETGGERAQRVAERIRQALADKPVTTADGEPLKITASIGIACYPVNANSTEALIANADRALYAAKQGGRNRVTVYSESVLH